MNTTISFSEEEVIEVLKDYLSKQGFIVGTKGNVDIKTKTIRYQRDEMKINYLSSISFDNCTLNLEPEPSITNPF